MSGRSETCCPGLWGVGDCALVPDPDTGGAAQHAIRQTKTLAENIAASVRGGSKQPFHFHTLGMFVCREHRAAVAEIRGFRFSGFLVWWLWRTGYLAKLPRLERKVRVALDWTLARVFPRDFAQLRPFRERGVSIPALEDSALPPRRGSRQRLRRYPTS